MTQIEPVLVKLMVLMHKPEPEKIQPITMTAIDDTSHILSVDHEFVCLVLLQRISNYTFLLAPHPTLPVVPVVGFVRGWSALTSSTFSTDTVPIMRQRVRRIRRKFPFVPVHENDCYEHFRFGILPSVLLELVMWRDRQAIVFHHHYLHLHLARDMMTNHHQKQQMASLLLLRTALPDLATLLPSYSLSIERILQKFLEHALGIVPASQPSGSMFLQQILDRSVCTTRAKRANNAVLGKCNHAFREHVDEKGTLVCSMALRLVAWFQLCPANVPLEAGSWPALLRIPEAQQVFANGGRGAVLREAAGVKLGLEERQAVPFHESYPSSRQTPRTRLLRQIGYGRKRKRTSD
jgi:hypothetical protein